MLLDRLEQVNGATVAGYSADGNLTSQDGAAQSYVAGTRRLAATPSHGYSYDGIKAALPG